MQPECRMYGNCPECTNCYNAKYSFDEMPEIQAMQVKWFQWEIVNQKMVKLTQTGSLKECHTKLGVQLRYFLRHMFIKRQQSEFFEEAKKNATRNSVVIQLDFAENHGIKYQHEIQSAHWSNQQVTIFTVYVWKGEGTGQGYAFISDELEHNKYAVFTFFDRLFLELQQSNPNLKELAFFSDGAASQFKQRFLFVNLSLMEQDYGLKVSWHFFATSHGKGVVDGIGGTLKRAVWRESMAGLVISSAEEFANVAKKSPKIKIIYVSKEEVNKHQERLDNRWSDTRGLPNTHSTHAIYPVKPYV